MLKDIDHKEVVESRFEFLERAFGSRLDFLYQGRKFSYIPAERVGNVFSGYFGREKHESVHAGPDDQFRLTDLVRWDLSFFAIDLSETRQIAFMQRNDNVGSPRPVLECFFDDLGQIRGMRNWQAHVRYISDSATYWDAARRYEGRITKLAFTFIPPNALRAEERVMDFIRDASRNAQATLVKHEYENKQGRLDPNGELIEGSVKVATAGGGDAVIKVGKRMVYSTKTQKMTTDIPEDEIPEPTDKPKIRAIIRRLFERFND